MQHAIEKAVIMSDSPILLPSDSNSEPHQEKLTTRADSGGNGEENDTWLPEETWQQTSAWLQQCLALQADSLQQAEELDYASLSLLHDHRTGSRSCEHNLHLVVWVTIIIVRTLFIQFCKKVDHFNTILWIKITCGLHRQGSVWDCQQLHVQSLLCSAVRPKAAVENVLPCGWSSSLQGHLPPFSSFRRLSSSDK